uniref:Copper type II ascorbate-dependent monooxygenase C-terminal domain-containing protein n=1 Tax=Biomphalaria glabrata TaxID=6526 RepID=A0A2C9JLJ9_BIOGL
MLTQILIVIASLLPCVTSFRSFQHRIPNGDYVPHPCKPNNIWEGVGHFLDEGTGFRNPFGEDFEKEGKIWTEALCRKDSDGDGLTNGQELGDPDCVWKENDLPSRQRGLSHPGNLSSRLMMRISLAIVLVTKYQNQEEWMRDMCKPKEFVCPGLNESDVHTLNMSLPSGTKVPAKPTTYMCQIYDFESLVPAGDYHLIAVEPRLDNKYVMHHIVLFGCTDDQVASDPFECGMVASEKCQQFLSVWTVGLAGECFHPETGVRVGTHGFKRMAMQFHWNNPDSHSDWVDSSGMMLHYTANRRKYDAGILLTGLQIFVLPPRQPTTTVKSTCTSSCTSQKFKGPVYVTMAWNHMHYAGRKMTIEVYRNNSALTYLSYEPIYNYDSPQVQKYTEHPIQLLPGDEIVSTCHYDTSTRPHSTFWGEATSDEMCFGFLTYYPKSNMDDSYCLSGGPDISYCDPTTYRNCSDLTKYANPAWVNTSSVYQSLQNNCRPFTPCLQECVDTIVDLKKNDPCFQDDMYDYIKNQMLSYNPLGKDIMARFSSCEREVYKALNSRSTQ